MQSWNITPRWLRLIGSAAVLTALGACATQGEPQLADLPCPPRPDPPAALLLTPPEATFQRRLQSFFGTLPETPTAPQFTPTPATGG